MIIRYRVIPHSSGRCTIEAAIPEAAPIAIEVASAQHIPQGLERIKAQYALPCQRIRFNEDLGHVHA